MCLYNDITFKTQFLALRAKLMPGRYGQMQEEEKIENHNADVAETSENSVP